MTVAAWIAATLLGVVCVFQLAIAAGAPLGAAAWGGQHPGVLPMRLRLASAVAGIGVYPLLIAVILAAGGVIGSDWLPVDPSVAAWALAVLLLVGSAANFASRSPRERIWGPVALVTAVCCVIVALG
jgi:hypothetical protein